MGLLILMANRSRFCAFASFFLFHSDLGPFPAYLLQDIAGSTSLTETTHTGVQIRVGLFICFIFNCQKYAIFEGSFFMFSWAKNCNFFKDIVVSPLKSTISLKIENSY